jgi:hypothetical protein
LARFVVITKQQKAAAEGCTENPTTTDTHQHPTLSKKLAASLIIVQG